MTDEDLIVALGFQKNPKCPFSITEPATSRNWLRDQIAAFRLKCKKEEEATSEWMKKRYPQLCAKKHDLPCDLELLSKQWGRSASWKIELSVLNECLADLIRERFREVHKREPKCPLNPFLWHWETRKLPRFPGLPDTSSTDSPK